MTTDVSLLSHHVSANEKHNGVMDIFVEPGPGIPVIKLAIHDGNFNGWVALASWEAVRIALKLLEAANATHVSSYTQPVKSIEKPLRKRGRPPSNRSRIPRLDAAAADGMDNVSGGVGQTWQSDGRAP